MALPQTVGFKAEAVGEGVWCVCTVEEEDDDYVIVSFDRDRILPDWKRKRRNFSLQ